MLTKSNVCGLGTLLQNYVAEANNAVRFLFSVEMNIVMIYAIINKLEKGG